LKFEWRRSSPDRNDRVGKEEDGTTTTQFLYDGLNPIQESNSSTGVANLLTGLRVDEYFSRTDTATSTFLADALGSTIGMVGSVGPAQCSGTEKRRDIATAVEHASDFDALGAFAIKDRVIADGEAPDRRVQFESLATCLGRVGQELALLVELIEKAVGGFGIVLRHENPDVGEVRLGEF
jgi:hypothetical protein